MGKQPDKYKLGKQLPRCVLEKGHINLDSVCFKFMVDTRLLAVFAFFSVRLGTMLCSGFTEVLILVLQETKETQTRRA